MKLKSKLLGLASIAALGLVSCAGDELKEAYSGEEISFTTRVARSTPTTVKNLDGFYVYANAEGYSSLLIDGMKADKVDDSECIPLRTRSHGLLMSTQSISGRMARLMQANMSLPM